MTLDERIKQGRLGAQPLCVAAKDFVCGAVRVAPELKSWYRPWRFTHEQFRALGSCRAWHPGLFRQMARTCAGITLQFETDSSEIFVELRLDEEPSGTRAMLDIAKRMQQVHKCDEIISTQSSHAVYDGVSVDIDGRHIPPVNVADNSYINLLLEDPQDMPLVGSVQLPGFGGVHKVCIHLPALRGCVIRSIYANGTFVRPLEHKPQLLVLGDSISQGFITGDPACVWVHTFAKTHNLEVVNQSIGGQVFQPGLLYGLSQFINPQVIIVELGANYRYEPCLARLVHKDIHAYFVELTHVFPQVPIFVLSPVWHTPDMYPPHKLSCFNQVSSWIQAQCRCYDNLVFVDGLRLLSHKNTMMADYYGHPGVHGSRELCERFSLVYASYELSHTPSLQASARSRALTLLDEVCADTTNKKDRTHAAHGVLGLREALRRGLGVLKYVDDDSILLGLSNGCDMLWSSNAQRARLLMQVIGSTRAVCLTNYHLLEALSSLDSYESSNVYYIGVYTSSKKRRIGAHRLIKPLDESYLDTIKQTYSYADSYTDEQYIQLLRRGCIVGAFDHDMLVGYIGEHEYGAIGMLEVFAPFRRKGWGKALESYKINQFLDRGNTAWLEIKQGNTESIALQRSLGVEVCDDALEVWIELKDQDSNKEFYRDTDKPVCTSSNR